MYSKRTIVTFIPVALECGVIKLIAHLLASLPYTSILYLFDRELNHLTVSSVLGEKRITTSCTLHLKFDTHQGHLFISK